MKIAHLSDWHNNIANTNFTIKKIFKTDPDYVVCTGDMISYTTEKLYGLYNLLEKISACYKVFYSLGNHELNNPNCELLLRNLSEMGIIVLDNRLHMENNLIFAGASLLKTVYRKNSGYKNLDNITINDLPKLQKNSNSTVILLAHNPNFLPVYSQWGADYVFSGHIHGGVFLGLLSPERKLFPKYYKNRYEYNGTIMSLSKGMDKFSFLRGGADIPIITLRGCRP